MEAPPPHPTHTHRRVGAQPRKGLAESLAKPASVWKIEKNREREKEKDIDHD